MLHSTASALNQNPPDLCLSLLERWALSLLQLWRASSGAPTQLLGDKMPELEAPGALEL